MTDRRRCEYCHTEMDRYERNTRPFAEVLYTCSRCGASTKRVTAHNPYAAEAAKGFDEPPAAGEWSR